MTYSAALRVLGIVLVAVAAGCGGGGGGSSGSIPGTTADTGGTDDTGGADGGVTYPDDPPLQTSVAALGNNLYCMPFENPDKPPVLLVHGTTVTGTEQFTFFYAPQLAAKGFDVCIVTYPDRGLIDQQISAEYVVYALRQIYAETGRQVAMIGHSQGASMPRWALRFFPSARAAVEDFVLIAGPNHGTVIAAPAALLEGVLTTLGLTQLPVGLLPESLYQFAPDSKFVAAVNSQDETPGDIDYTSLATLFDELVQPPSTTVLDAGQNNPRVANILLQDVCPGHLAEHLSIGTTDSLAFALALDAISNPGPANVERAGGSALCSLLPVDLASLTLQPPVQGLLTIVADDVQRGLPELHLANQEPPLMPYAHDALE